VLAIRVLPAGHGDALVVEYGSRDRIHRLLVDGGPLGAWDSTVKPALLALPNQRFEAFVVTHIDEDHIGGAIKLLNDTDLRHRVGDVWFNGYIHCDKAYHDDVLGPIDGERLTHRIGKGGFAWNSPFAPRIDDHIGGPVVVARQKNKLPAIKLPGGATIHLLSPTWDQLDKLAQVWESVVAKAGIAPGEGTPLEARKLPVRQRDMPPLPASLDRKSLERLAEPTCPDTSEANGSSIAFIVEYERRRVLLGADAHADVLVQSLRTFGDSVGEDRVRLDLVKLPHHGSKANVTTELIDVIDAKRYVVSTNGDNFGHPDYAALARIILASRQPPTFYCNYRTPVTTAWAERAPVVGATFVLPKNESRPGLRVPATA
jgi:beta-lactamase superfamily II metal-dependent hydrolase